MRGLLTLQEESAGAERDFLHGLNSCSELRWSVDVKKELTESARNMVLESGDL